MLKALVLVCFAIPCVSALSALSGTVRDSAMMPIDGAQITLSDESALTTFRTSTSAGGFSILGVRDGDYLFEVVSDGKLPVYGAVHMSGGTREINVVMIASKGHRRGEAGAGAALRSAIRPNGVSPRIAPARVLKKVEPVYPVGVKAGGTVRIAAVILADGKLDDLVVLSAPDERFAPAALLAVRRWQYTPTQADGRPTESNITIDVNFHR